MMTRKEHIQYCKVCERRKFSKQEGIICGLTNKIADFEDDCANFLGDRSAIIPYPSQTKKTRQTKKIKPRQQPLWIKKTISLSFKRAKENKLTMVLFSICLMVFLAMLVRGVHWLQPNINNLMAWGGNYKPLVMSGQYWRLVSSFFVHAGIIHFVFNMIALVYMGMELENRIGRFKLLFVFLLSGLMGSVSSFVWNSAFVSVGCGGAILGLYGTFAVLRLRGAIKDELKASTLISIMFYLTFSIMNGFQPGVDNAVLIGGLVGGLILGFSLVPAISHPDQKAKAIDSHAFAILGIILLCVFVLNFYSKRTGAYDRLMLQFVEVEQEALALYRLDANASNEEVLKTIYEDGIPNWELSKELVIKAGNTPNVLDENRKRIELLKVYCDYRIQSYKLIARSIKEDNTQLDGKINEYNVAIERLVQKLQQGDLSTDYPVVEPINNYIRSGLPQKAVLSKNDYAGLVVDYNHLMQEFLRYEKKALVIYQSEGSLDDPWVLKFIENDGLPNFQRCKELATKAAQISHISDQNRLRARMLMRYCDYRMEAYRLTVKKIKGDAEGLEGKMAEYNRAIVLIAKGLLKEELEDDFPIVMPLAEKEAGSTKVLYVVDGRPVPDESYFSQEDVKSMTVLKSEVARQIYGERGKNGVILVTTNKFAN